MLHLIRKLGLVILCVFALVVSILLYRFFFPAVKPQRVSIHQTKATQTQLPQTGTLLTSPSPQLPLQSPVAVPSAHDTVQPLKIIYPIIKNIGDGSLTVDDQGNLYPTFGTGKSGSIGLANSRFGAGYFNTLDSSGLNIGGMGTFQDLRVRGNAEFGNITGLNGVTYSFPSTQGSTNTYLTNNGSGSLSWGSLVLSAGVSGILPIANGGTNATALPTAGGIAYGNGTAYAFTSAGTSGLCLTSGGSGAPSWVSCASTAGGQFAAGNGAVYPLNSTEDLLVGGQASTSAKFAVLNVNNGTPTASVSAGVAGAAYLTADGKLATTARQTLTLGDANTGNLILSQGGSIGIGTANPTAKIEISGAGGNYMKFTTPTAFSTDTIYSMFNNRATFGYDGTVQGVLISDNAASKPIVFQTGGSALERMRITATGSVVIAGLNTAGGVLYTDSSGTLLNSGAGTSGYCLISNGSNAPIWTTCPVAVDNLWTLNSNGTLFPSNPTPDVLIGANGTGTSSARVAFLNIASGTPTASLSAGIAGATYLSAAGNLQTTARQTLTLGGSTTGGIAFSPLNGFSNNQGILLTNSAGLVSQTLQGASNTVLHGNGSATPTFSAVSLTGDVTGLLPITNGGTNNSSPYTAGSLIFSDGTKLTQNNSNLFWDNSTNRLGIGKNNPSFTVDVNGIINGQLQDLGGQVYNVKAFGAQGDGATDDTTAIQATLDAANTKGGEVYFPPGTYISTTLILYSKVHLRGAGIEASIIKLKNASNVDLIKSFGFDSLTGTNSTGGIYNWSMSDLTLDGNKTNNTLSGDGMRVYGYGFILQNVRVRNAHTDGIYSEWSTSGASPGFDSMEAHISGLKVHNNGQNGITWNGPHDSSFVNTQIYQNADKGVWLLPAATGAQFTNGHAWGNTNYGWYVEAGSVSLDNTEGEGSFTAQVMLGGGNDTITGGIYFAAGATSATGIQLGDGTHTPTGFNIDTLVTGFNSGTGVAFNADGGGGSIKANVYQTGSTGVSGNPSTSTAVNIHVNGGGTGAMTNFASGNVGIGNNAPAVKLDVIGTVRAVSAGTQHIGAYLIPQGGAGNSFRMGFGNNAYFNGTNWVTVGDGSNNGGSLMLSGYGASNSNLVFYTMPSTGGAAQTISDSTLANFEKMRLSATGSLGLGNTTPVSLLDIKGAVTGKALVNINEIGNQNLLTASASGVTKFSIDRSGDMIVAAGGKWQPLTDSTTAMNIANAAGTNFVSFDSVNTRFVVTGASGQLLKLSTASNLGSDTSTILFNNRVAIGYDGTIGSGAISLSDSGSNKPTVFVNGGTERMRILPTGTVGVGTSAPLAQLQVNGDFGGNASLIINSLNSSDILSASASGTTVFRLDNGGNLITATGAKIQPLSDSSSALNFANAAGTSFVSFDTFASRININSAAAQSLRLNTIGNTSADTSTILFNNRAVIGYDGTAQGVLIGDSATSKPIIFQTGATAIERMRITPTGSVVIAGLNTAGGVIYTDSSGTLLNSGAGTSGLCLTSGGSGAPTWASCSSSAGNQFTIGNGAIYPLNSTSDLLVGGQASASAKFAVLNVNNGTPTASVSAGVAGAAYLTADGRLATTARQTLTLGDANTGNLILSQGGSIGIGTTTPTAKIEISGAGGNYMKFTTTGALSTDTIYSMFNNRATFGYDGTVQGVLISDNATSKPIVFQTGGSGIERMRITSTGSVVIAGLNTAGGVMYTDGSGTLLTSGAGTTGLCLTSGGSGSPTWASCSSSAGNQFTIGNGAIYPLNSTTDLLVGGQASASAKFAFLNVNSGTPTASVSAGVTGATYLTAAGKLATTARQTLTLGDGNTGNLILSQGGSIGIGTANPTAKIEISGAGGNYMKFTTPTALSTDTIYTMFNSRATFGYDGTVQGVLISDNATSKPIVFQTGATAIERMRITPTGSVVIAGLNTAGGVMYTDGSGTLLTSSAGTSGLCLTSGGSGAPSWVSCSTAAGNQFTTGNGAIYPLNSTSDLLVGGQASASAKFAFLNVNSGTPIASVSAGVTGAAYLTADGKLATTARQTLTLGDANTGNLILSQGGSIGIGTTTPTAKIEISGAGGNYMKFTTTGALSTDTIYTMFNNRATFGYDGTVQGVLISDNATNKPIAFQTGATALERMRISNTGLVGIGTNNPGNLLDVSGSTPSTASAMIRNTSSSAGIVGLAIKLSSTTLDNSSRFVNFLDLNGTIIGKIQASGPTSVNYATNGTDFAEYFNKENATDTFHTGDLVVTGNTKQSAVLATKSYDSKLLGIVSAHPGFTGGKEGPDRIIVALTGQVPVNIDPSSSPIQPGDPLTSSASNPGMAIKAVQAGAIVAKAQEAWTPGSGMSQIMAYVNVSWFDPTTAQPVNTTDAADTTTLNLTVLKKLEAQGAVTFKSDVSFEGKAIFLAFVEFFDKVVFHNDVTFSAKANFKDEVSLDKNSAGYAKVAAGGNEVSVIFQKEYLNSPIINITPLGGYELKYWVTNATTKGFTIKINPAISEEAQFSWTAFSVKDPAVVSGTAQPSTVMPTVTPSASPLLSPSPITPSPSVSTSPAPTSSPTLSPTPVPTLLPTPSPSPLP